jgi:hypothetical protein
MFRLPLLATLTLLVGAPSLTQPAARPAAVAEARTYRPIEAIRWTYDDESFPGGSSWQLRFKHDHSSSSIGPDDSADVQRIVDTLSHAGSGEAVSFSLSREAGALAGTGRAQSGGRGGSRPRARAGPDHGP